MRFCKDFIQPKILQRSNCEGIDCMLCQAIMNIWLQEEYQPSKIDWNNVPIDTPVLVKNYEDGEWEKRYFAYYNENDEYDACIVTFANGATSFSASKGKYSETFWHYGKLWEGSEEQQAEEKWRKRAWRGNVYRKEVE